MPQVLPVLHELALALSENDAPALILEAKVDIFFFTFGLPHLGQLTSLIALLLRTNSSKGRPHSSQTNSKIGILSPGVCCLYMWHRNRHTWKQNINNDHQVIRCNPLRKVTRPECAPAAR
jgi:hypothetical protein